MQQGVTNTIGGPRGSTDPDGVVPASARAGRLMVILADPMSPLIAKGEVTARYYNPGNLFDEVIFVICADDAPDVAAVQHMVGDARFEIHNAPIGRDWTVRSLFWRPALLRAWTQPIVELARARSPQLVRCHHNRYNAFAAAEIKRQLGTPYVVSLHAHPQTSQAKRLSSAYLRHRLREAALEAISRQGLAGADAILPVYSPIVPWLQQRGIERYEIVYNAVGTLARPVERVPRGEMLRAINVGRQDADIKDPTPIIDAVAARSDVRLTVVGNGPLHEALVARVHARGAQDRIEFRTSVPNTGLLELMAAHDVLLFSTHATEFSKVCIEAALLGLAIVHNDLQPLRPSELDGSHVLVVENSASGFGAALATLMATPGLVEEMGSRARDMAAANWAPDVMEARVVAIYREMIAGASRKR